MDLSQEQSDQAVLLALGERLARYRLNRNQTQQALAQEAGVSRRTLIRIENGESVQLTNLVRVLRALGLLQHFDALVPEPAASPVQQVKLQGRIRQRASSPSPVTAEEQPWSWGEDE